MLPDGQGRRGGQAQLPELPAQAAGLVVCHVMSLSLFLFLGPLPYVSIPHHSRRRWQSIRSICHLCQCIVFPECMSLFQLGLVGFKWTARFATHIRIVGMLQTLSTCVSPLGSHRPFSHHNESTAATTRASGTVPPIHCRMSPQAPLASRFRVLRPLLPRSRNVEAQKVCSNTGTVHIPDFFICYR